MTCDPNKWCLRWWQRGHSSKACPRVKVLLKPAKPRGLAAPDFLFFLALVCGGLSLAYLGHKLAVYTIAEGVKVGAKDLPVCLKEAPK